MAARLYVSRRVSDHSLPTIVEYLVVWMYIICQHWITFKSASLTLYAGRP